MKKCTYCGKEYPDEAKACAVDAQPLIRVPSTGMPPELTGDATPDGSEPEADAQFTPESPHQVAANRDMLVGGLWCLGGIIVTVVTYSSVANSPGGGTYVVAWGAILFGALRFIRGLTGESKAKPKDDSAEAQSLLDIAARFENVDRAKAVEKYEEIVRLFPDTAASREAQRNIHTLTTRRE